MIRPPSDITQVGRAIQLRVATSQDACASTKTALSLITSGAIPIVDKKSIDFWVDEGRLELRGSGLEGTRLEWETPQERGADLCLTPTVVSGQQSCAFSVSRRLRVAPELLRLRLYPQGANLGSEVFDRDGEHVPQDSLQLVPARWLISAQLVREGHIDLSTGEDHLAILHPDAIAAVECDVARCDLEGGGVRVRGSERSIRTMGLRLRLLPHVWVRSGDSWSQTHVANLDVTYCPLTVVSPAPARDTEDVSVVVRAEGRCAVTDEGTRFTANGSPVSIAATETEGKFVYLLLNLGRVTTERITLTALRDTAVTSILGVTSIATTEAPQLRVSLQLDGLGGIDFIPTNREAKITASAPVLHGKIVAIPVDGVYDIHERAGRSFIRGIAEGGFVVLRFALRDDSLPGALARADLAHLSGHVQRAVREVNVTAPLGKHNQRGPIAEVLCAGALGQSLSVVPGVPLHIPFAQRDGCRLLIHRERIPIEDGEQRLNINIEVTSVSGTTRSEGHFSQRLLLRHGSEPRTIWIRGVKAQFDRVSVQLAHVVDENQYLRGGGEQVEVPSGQWTVIVENTSWRLYATAAIPVQLFRFSNDPGGAGTGPLSLNLGVLAHFTWVTHEGAEGILGLEGGVMGMGLAANNTRQLNLVGGLGLGVPVGNAGQPSQASINIHAWVAYRLGDETAPLSDASGTSAAGGPIHLRPWSFIFGPSVSFGNLGFNL